MRGWPACLVRKSLPYQPGEQPELFKELMKSPDPFKAMRDLDIQPQCLVKKEKDFPQNYEGLKQLAHVLAVTGSKYQKHGENIAAVLCFQQARSIDPDMEYLSQLAEVLETEGCYVLARDVYMDAIDRLNPHDTQCSKMNALACHAIFNYADMLENRHPELDDCCEKNQEDVALDLYEKGALLFDTPCLARALTRLSIRINDPANTSERYRFYNIYTLMVTMETCRCKKDDDDDDDECECVILDPIFCQDIGSISNDWDVFEDFQSEYTILRITLLAEQECERLKNEQMVLEYERLEACLDILRSRVEYRCYKNKIELFTQLNHVGECPICYETKVKIDLPCAHTFCGDCYTRFYNKECPMCRTDCRCSHIR
jgi:tetratricopeptide (TPR) repeat protein